MQVGGVALLGGDPTVNITALEGAPAPRGRGTAAMPQAPGGARERKKSALLSPYKTTSRTSMDKSTQTKPV